MEAQELHALVSAVCPIEGVSVGDPQNKSTWRIDFSDGATEAQIAAAGKLVANLEP